MRIAITVAATLALAGCAANSGVAPTGPDSFVVSRQAATGFSGSGTLKGEALTEAGQFCASQNKTFLVTDSKEAAPPYVTGNFPKAEVSFMCLTADDPRLAPPPDVQTGRARKR
jgi:hypothetical protein